MISWPTPASISADVALSATQLNATIDSVTKIDGVFTYTPALGSLLTVGSQTLSVIFAPKDLINFQVAKKSVTIIITATPIEVVPVLSGVSPTYDGSAKSIAVGSIPAGVSYSITYNGSSTVPTNAGIYAVAVKVTSEGYFGSANGTFTILRANAKFNWNNPAPFTSDQILSEVQLNATADIPGTFTYTPAAGSRLMPGHDALSTQFVPLDQVNYASAQFSIWIDVALPPVIKVPPGTIPPVYLATIAPVSGSTKLTPAQIKAATAKAVKKGSVIQIWSYVKPTKNVVADQKLSLQRANEVKAQLIKQSPKVTYSIKAMGSKIEPSCAKTQNLCIIIKVVG